MPSEKSIHQPFAELQLDASQTACSESSISFRSSFAFTPSEAAIWESSRKERVLVSFWKSDMVKIFALVALAFVAGEAALRFRAEIRFGEAKSSYYLDHAELGHILKPNFTTSGTRGTLHINSLGFRGPELSDLPEDGAIRIACLGTSPVFGGTMDDDLVFPEVLKRLLNESQTESPVDVINAGVPGWGAEEMLYHFEHYVLSHRPSIAIIYPSFNDFPRIMGWPGTGEESSGPKLHFLKRWRKEHSVFHKTFRDKLAALNPERAGEQFTEFPTDSEDWFEEIYTKMCDLCRKNGVIPVLCTQVRAYRRDQPLSLQRKYGSGWGLGLEANYTGDKTVNAAVRAVAGEQSIVLVDLTQIVPGGPEYFMDGVHFSPQGHEKVAEALSRAILKNHLLDAAASKKE